MSSLGVEEICKKLAALRNDVELLKEEKDTLRQAVRKLKVENSRVKDRVKKLETQVKLLGGHTENAEEDFPSYDEIGRDFILVGGIKDPLSLRFEAAFTDSDKIEHKSAERYYWYQMAQKFNDEKSCEKILKAESFEEAEEISLNIEGFDESEWNEVKMSVWEDAQRYKLDQNRWIQNVLFETGSTYIGLAHHDKVFGTGWRKSREESNKPIFWDGQNLGGKSLMKYRSELAANHSYKDDDEKNEARSKVEELKKLVWRRSQDYNKRNRGRGRGHGYRKHVA